MTGQAIASMAERYERPAWVRRLNAMADSVGGAIEGARKLAPIDADDLLETATRSLGGGSFGGILNGVAQLRARMAPSIDHFGVALED